MRPSQIIDALHADCAKALQIAHDSKHDSLNGASYAVSTDLDAWIAALNGRSETALYVAASNEFVLALLCNSQALYRNAFKGLRLVLELVLQGAYLSVNIVTLNEWLKSQADTSWQTILDKDRGVFAARFCKAFFPEVETEVPAFKTLSETLYREMSECIHGNVPNKIPLPRSIAFDDTTFRLWHDKAARVRLIINFVLMMRYLRELPEDRRAIITLTLTEQLSYIGPVRGLLGGPQHND